MKSLARFVDFYLLRAAFLDGWRGCTRRGRFTITPRGRALLQERPRRIDISLLDRIDEFRAFRRARRPLVGPGPDPAPSSPENIGETPEEILEQAYQRIPEDLAVQLLKQVKESSPRFFEKLVVEVLLKMGCGGNRAEAGRAIGQSGDEGIDGIFSEDRLGLDAIYIQAKRWEGTVGRPEIQKFVGALHGKRARKGVFITTGTFSADAKEHVGHIDPRVVLIDGRQLAEHMVDLGLGVTLKAAYDVKRIDSDDFTEES